MRYSTEHTFTNETISLFCVIIVILYITYLQVHDWERRLQLDKGQGCLLCQGEILLFYIFCTAGTKINTPVWENKLLNVVKDIKEQRHLGIFCYSRDSQTIRKVHTVTIFLCITKIPHANKLHINIYGNFLDG
jgi:hypothetical protein